MLEINGAVQRPMRLTVVELQTRYPAHTVAIHYANDDRRVDATFTGAHLWDILQSAGVESVENLRVMALARDCFRCILRHDEVDSAQGGSPILVGYAQDGQPLSDKDGPLRLVVPGDERGLRYLRGLVTLTVLNSRQGDDEPDDVQLSNA